MTISASVREPEFMMPPPGSPGFPVLPLVGMTPSGDLPLVMVSPDIVAVTPENTVKILKFGVPGQCCDGPLVTRRPDR